MISMKRIKSILFFILGILSLALGVAGTVLPVLPGAPFYLFAVFCFARSSKRIEQWLKNTELYQKYAGVFLENKGMTLKEKIRINVIADFFIILSLIYVDILFVRVMMVVLALYKHYYFIKKIKTIHP